MQNVLVTGDAGFIGSNFVRYLLKVDRRVCIVNLDALTYAGSLENLKGLPDEARHVFVQGDIGDFELVSKLLRENEVDTLVHFAAESHVDRSILGPAPFIQTNVTGTFTLLEAARQVWAEDRSGRRFHHVSTDEVFGSLDLADPAFTETTPSEPRSPYSASIPVRLVPYVILELQAQNLFQLPPVRDVTRLLSGSLPSNQCPRTCRYPSNMSGMPYSVCTSNNNNGARDSHHGTRDYNNGASDYNNDTAC